MHPGSNQGNTFEVGMYRPPSEGGSYSLLVRVTRNCPWNQCTFCDMYKDNQFSHRSPEAVMGDIDAIAALCSELKSFSHAIGHHGDINRHVAIAMINQYPYVNTSQEFLMVFNWLSSGAKTAFLQDANSLILGKKRLVTVLHYLRKKFPALERVTTYARSKTLERTSLENLTAIREAGLDRLHVGLETGDDLLLKQIKKGVSSDAHILGGRKAMAAGYQLSEYWMPGLGGRERWEAHALNTARVLNEINPDYIRSRPFFPLPGTPFFESCDRKEFQPLSARQLLDELKLMIEHLDFNARVCFDHAGNVWSGKNDGFLFKQDYEGYKFPEEKSVVLDLIEEGLKK